MLKILGVGMSELVLKYLPLLLNCPSRAWNRCGMRTKVGPFLSGEEFTVPKFWFDKRCMPQIAQIPEWDGNSRGQTNGLNGD